MTEKIKEIERAIVGGYYHCALALTLTIPDICGQVYKHELSEKLSDKDIYIRWFDEFVAQIYLKQPNLNFPNGTNIAFDGCACYRLRCAYLHNGNYNLKARDKKIQIKEFRLHYSKPSISYKLYEITLTDEGDFILDIDVSGFCKVICMAAMNYYNNISNKSLFTDSMIAYIEEGAENGN